MEVLTMPLLYGAVVVFLVGFAGAVMARQYLLWRKRGAGESLPEGSMGWPLIGETLAFLKPHTPYTLGSFLQHHSSKYGKVFKSHIFGRPTIVSCDEEVNEFILHNEEKLFRGSYPSVMHSILGPLSLLIASGHLHRRLRSHVVRFASSSKSNPDYPRFVHSLCVYTIRSWKPLNQILFHNESRKFLFNLTVKQVLSIEAEDPLASNILDDFLTFMKGFVSLPLAIPGTAYTKALKARRRIMLSIKNIMKERRIGQCTRKGDLLDILLSSDSNSNSNSNSHERLTDEEIVSVVMDTLLGGYETTSTLLSLIVYFVGQAPLVLEQLKGEQEAIKNTKRKGEEALNWEDYKKMNFTSSVILEALRCGNVVKFVHREALAAVDFKGYRIPAGWKVFPVLAAPHLDPLIHENPSHFNPWRWQAPRMGKKVFPFGGGLRLCPGYELAKLQTAFFLHHFVINYRWKLKEDFPLAYPYVDFPRGLPLQIESIN